MSTLTEKPGSYRVRRSWRFPWAQALACLLILVGVCVFLYPQAASWFSQKEQSRVTELAQEQLEQPPNSDAVFRAEQIAAAHAYNDALASGALYEANANVAVGDRSGVEGAQPYNELLNSTGNGFMARLQYESLSIDLPIYHGSSDETLAHGVGHLEGTSLPVGGIGTRAVLTAHRGLPSATLFDNLNNAKIGDIFTVSVLDQVLTYRVSEIQVIQPDQTEAILADPDRDLVTLVTCTPLGINSHRILVTAERVMPTPPESVAAAEESPDLPGFPWWALILTATMLGVSLNVWRAGYVDLGDLPNGVKSP